MGWIAVLHPRLHPRTISPQRDPSSVVREEHDDTARVVKPPRKNKRCPPPVLSASLGSKSTCSFDRRNLTRSLSPTWQLPHKSKREDGDASAIQIVLLLGR